MIKEFSRGRIFVSRLPHGADLLESLTNICIEKEVATASVKAIGALSSAVVAFYNQDARRYEEIRLEGKYEILGLMGNVSIRDGAPLCHLHLTLGDDRGNACGGHLVKGCRIYACEAVIEELVGPQLVRGFDEETSLPLWD